MLTHPWAVGGLRCGSTCGHSQLVRFLVYVTKGNIDTYVICIRQVAALLGYCKPQTLEVFKNTLPLRLYWVLFPVDDLGILAETAKRNLTKEKIDRQVASYSTSIPFMKIRYGKHNKKSVTFSTQDRLDNKMSKVTAQGNNLNNK